MKIALLGWGSLVWDLRKVEIEGDFKQTNFKLPIQYSRISDSGNGRVTLVLDPINGEDIKINYVKMKENNLNNAINQLKERERTIYKNIGYINLKDGNERSNILSDEYLNKIKKWAHKNNFEGIIWTDIPSNWEKIRKKPYSLNDVIEYLNEKRENDILVYNLCIEYITNCYQLANICLPLTKIIISKC